MYAIIRAGGKQTKVQEGDVIDVERLKTSGAITFTPVLLVEDDGTVISDRGALETAVVTAEVVGEHRGEKVDVFKYKSKSGYRRHQGHRQTYTTLQVTKIAAGTTKAQAKAGEKAPAKASEKVPAEAPAKATAKAPAKATAKAPAKAPAKPAAKSSAKVPAKATKKAPAKPATKAAAKSSAKVPAKATKKAPAKPAKTAAGDSEAGAPTAANDQEA